MVLEAEEMAHILLGEIQTITAADRPGFRAELLEVMELPTNLLGRLAALVWYRSGVKRLYPKLALVTQAAFPEDNYIEATLTLARTFQTTEAWLILMASPHKACRYKGDTEIGMIARHPTKEWILVRQARKLRRDTNLPTPAETTKTLRKLLKTVSL